MFLKPRKQKHSFCSIFQQEQRFFFDTSKKCKKEKQCSKDEAKKKERYTKWEIIFQDTKKTKHRKNKLIFEEAQQKRKGIFFAEA